MKTLSYILGTLLIISCQNNSNSNFHKKVDNIVNQKKCEEIYDSTLIDYAKKFKANEINLDKNLSSEVSAFIIKTDSVCLEKQKQYKIFISTVLAKLYLHHLQCCNQGFDLLSMKNGAASIIISAFEKLAGYKEQDLEMLNSGTIVDYIDNDPSLKTNDLIIETRKKIGIEIARIGKGI